MRRDRLRLEPLQSGLQRVVAVVIALALVLVTHSDRRHDLVVLDPEALVAARLPRSEQAVQDPGCRPDPLSRRSREGALPVHAQELETRVGPEGLHTPAVLHRDRARQLEGVLGPRERRLGVLGLSAHDEHHPDGQEDGEETSHALAPSARWAF